MRKSDKILGFAVAALMPTLANASVAISPKPTANMSCSDGACSPTAKNAVLNVTDLAGMLMNGNVSVQSGSVAQDIVIEAALSWTNTNRLTLDSYRSITFNKPVEVTGTGSVALTYNDGGAGGDLSFTNRGVLSFWDLSSSLVINNQPYMLVKTLKDLKTAVGVNRDGFFALANDYNAQKDGAYSKSPISTLGGTIEGLGHPIQNLTIISTQEINLALMNMNKGTIRDFRLTNVNISGQGSHAAALTAQNSGGTIHNCYATGTIQGYGAGGLVALNRGTISNSGSAVTVVVDGFAGGLTAENFGLIETSYATGSVTGDSGEGASSEVGGLTGVNNGTISKAYATGMVAGAYAGGLAGTHLSQGHRATIQDSYASGAVTGSIDAGGLTGLSDDAAIKTSYATGQVTGPSGSAGGLIGYTLDDSNDDGYWDLDTSGISNPAQGAGNVANDPGITGLTDAQLKSGLPSGFDPTIWKETKGSGGYPSLIDNPPQ